METRGYWIESIYEAFVNLGGYNCKLADIYKEVGKIRSKEKLTWRSLDFPHNVIRREIQQRTPELKSYNEREKPLFKKISSGTYSLRGMDDPFMNEIRSRISLWRNISNQHDTNSIPQSVIKENNLYKGQAGIYKQGGDLTLTVNHTGKSYPDDVSEDAILYHYPQTSRKGKDEAEIEATKKCLKFNVPIFILLPNLENKKRTLRLGWVKDFDDEHKLFYIEFYHGHQNIKLENNKNNEQEFKLIESEKSYKNILSKARKGQPKFRIKLLKRYGNKCAFCSITHLELLIACHIRPDSKKGTNDPRNGMMLCANCHLAFDNFLITVQPKTKKIISKFKDLGIGEVHLNPAKEDFPHNESLEWHYKEYLKVNLPK